MNSITLPVRIAALAALVALPFSFAAAGMLALTAALGAIICADYSHRYRGLRLPRRQVATAPAAPAAVQRAIFRAPPIGSEPNRLAA